jgi:hypothetical protein
METTMKMIDSITDDTQALADLEEVCRLISEGKKVTDPDLISRIEEQAQEARREDMRIFGVREVGVDIIREMRDPKV